MLSNSSAASEYSLLFFQKYKKILNEQAICKKSVSLILSDYKGNTKVGIPKKPANKISEARDNTFTRNKNNGNIIEKIYLYYILNNKVYRYKLNKKCIKKEVNLKSLFLGLTFYLWKLVQIQTENQETITVR